MKLATCSLVSSLTYLSVMVEIRYNVNILPKGIEWWGD